MTQLAVQTGDPLTPWLESLKPSTGVFCRAEVRAPWGFRIEARDEATFHILARGNAILEVQSLSEPVQLKEGDFVLLAGGDAHQLRDTPSSPVRRLEHALAGGSAVGKHFAFGGKGDASVMVCGTCRLGALGVNRALLPPMIRYPCDTALVGLVEREADSLALGGEAVLTQLLALMVTQALRAHLTERGPEEWTALLSGPVSAVLSFMHRSLDCDIQLKDLCSKANVSRSSLHEQFQDTIGTSPMNYLRSLRLARARELLLRSGAGLQAIARSVGYGSASTFSRAFRKEFGMSPGQLRKTA